MKAGITCLWMWLALFMFAVSCTDREGNEGGVEKGVLELKSEAEVVLSANRQSFNVSFLSSADWRLSADGITWCTFSADAGKGMEDEQTIQVWLEENTGEADRNVKLTLRAGDQSVSLFVVQKSAKSLTVTADRFELDGNGEYMVVKVQADVECRYEIDPTAQDWLSPVDENNIPEGEVPNAGVMTRSGERTFYFRAAPGLPEEGREGKIVFYGNTSDGSYLEEEVYVYQRVRDEIVLGSGVEYIGSEGGTVRLDLRSNVDYEVVMPSVQWLRQAEQSATRSLSSHTLYFEVDPSTEYSDRKAEITVRKAGTAELSQTFTIVQAQKDAVILEPRGEYRLDEFEHIFQVKVQSNVQTEGPVIDTGFRDFLSEVDKSGLKTRALTENVYYFKVTASESSVERTGYIRFNKMGSKEVSDYLEVIQGKKRILTFDQDTVRLSASKGRFDVKLRVSDGLDYEVLCSDSWITRVAGPDGVNELSYTFEVTDNDQMENSKRTGYIVARQKNEIISDTITVVQESYRYVQVTEPGNLVNQIDAEDKYLISSLRLSGRINGSDIRYLREMAGATYEGASSTNGSLVALDLTDTEIVAGGGAYGIMFGDKYYTNDRGVGVDTVPEGGKNYSYYSEGIGAYMFTNCWKLEDIKCPKSLRVIQNEAFREFGNQEGQAYMQQLKRVTLYPGLEEIKENAFYQNLFLEEINLPESLVLLGERAFYHCARLKEVTVPGSVKDIQLGTFEACYSLSKVSLSEGVERIQLAAFRDCRMLSQINTPASLKEVGGYAFFRCYRLAHPLFPVGVTSIEASTYYECAIEDVNVPATVTVIGKEAFYKAGVARLTLPEGLKEIGEGAFMMNGLASVTIPASVTKIGKDCFSYNDGLKELHLKPVVPPEITDAVSGNTGDVVLYVPKGCKDIYTAHTYWGAYVHIVEE